MDTAARIGGSPTILAVAGAAFALAGLWMLLRPRSEGRAAHAVIGLVVVLVGAALLALPWLAVRPGSAPAAAPEPEPVATAGGISLSADGLRTVATPAAPRPPPPLPGRQAARIAIEASEAEPNDNLAIANVAELGSAIAGALEWGDLDYFAVDVPAGTRSEIVVGLVVSEGDAGLTLFDDAGQALGSTETRSELSVRTSTVVRKIDRPRYHVLVLATRPAGAIYQLTIVARRW